MKKTKEEPKKKWNCEWHRLNTGEHTIAHAYIYKANIIICVLCIAKRFCSFFTILFFFTKIRLCYDSILFFISDDFLLCDLDINGNSRLRNLLEKIYFTFFLLFVVSTLQFSLYPIGHCHFLLIKIFGSVGQQHQHGIYTKRDLSKTNK